DAHLDDVDARAVDGEEVEDGRVLPLPLGEGAHLAADVLEREVADLVADRQRRDERVLVAVDGLRADRRRDRPGAPGDQPGEDDQARRGLHPPKVPPSERPSDNGRGGRPQGLVPALAPAPPKLRRRCGPRYPPRPVTESLDNAAIAAAFEETSQLLELCGDN